MKGREEVQIEGDYGGSKAVNRGQAGPWPGLN